MPFKNFCRLSIDWIPNEDKFYEAKGKRTLYRKTPFALQQPRYGDHWQRAASAYPLQATLPPMREVLENAVRRDDLNVFAELVRADMTQGAIDFHTLQEHRYMKFWSQLTMTEYSERQDTFKFIYMGTGVVANLGRDCTGMTIREILVDDEAYRASHDMDMKVVRHKEIIFRTGDAEISGNTQLQWNAVSLPLKKEAILPLCLTYTTFVDHNPSHPIGH